MDINLGDKVKETGGPVRGLVVGITRWLIEGDADRTERADIGVRTTGSDRISWLDSEFVTVTSKAK